MKLIDTGIVVWRQKVYIQATGDEELDVRNRGAVRDRMCHLKGAHPDGPLNYLEVPEPVSEVVSEVDRGDGEETISHRLTRAWSLYAEGGALGTNTCNFLEVMAAAVAELDARTCRKVGMMDASKPNMPAKFGEAKER